MEPQISTALSLLLTGMITVFMVLLLVVITGNVLIRFVNAYLPEASVITATPDRLDKRKIAAINAAVEHYTKGTGRVTRIEKLN